MTRGTRQAALLYQVPLALLSFLFFRGFRWLMRQAADLHHSLRMAEARRWRPLSAQTLRNPLALPVLMTSAPRWNPHAVIATAGPLPVRRSLAINVAEAQRSAATWSVVIYTYPAYRTVTTIDSLHPSATADRELREVLLPPGRYWLGLRYYHPAEGAALPTVLLDGKPGVSAQSLPPDVNGFYEGLARRGGLLYFCLHYYVWVLLRLKGLVPRRIAEREYLPVGNPGTRFRPGCLERGQTVQVEVEAAVLETHDVFLTVYNRASFPVFWDQVTSPLPIMAPFAGPGHYLVRIHPRRPDAGLPDECAVRVTVNLK
jgi:Family of unknown function (DUF6208)